MLELQEHHYITATVHIMSRSFKKNYLNPNMHLQAPGGTVSEFTCLQIRGWGPMLSAGDYLMLH